ncbi:MAG: imidazolonepropionase [Acidimicrobiia bacterium]|nr:imidazolonepropionase [Acidimicrobiia bacterium]
MSVHFDTLVIGAKIATLGVSDDYGLVNNAVIGIADGRVAYLGPRSTQLTTANLVDAGGRLLTPALIDCHTHLVFAGDRFADFERRLRGDTYAEIAEGGGGIKRTMVATRLATEDELYELAAPRVQWLMESGVATIEIKSGYGLSVDSELRMLRVARRLGDAFPVTVSTSLLGAHAVPPEFSNDVDGYVDLVCDEMIPRAAAAGLADSVDAFCETIAFSADQVTRIFAAAEAADLPVRLHADQLSNLGGAQLAAASRALSADHLEHASVEGLDAMAAAGTVAVLIPGASTFLDEQQRPPIAAMRKAGVRMAVASDLNPGSAPLGSMQLALALAATRFGLTPAETLHGATRHAAAALGFEDRGEIRLGHRADLAIWDVEDPAALSYWFGAPLLSQLWIAGSLVEGVGSNAR